MENRKLTFCLFVLGMATSGSAHNGVSFYTLTFVIKVFMRLSALSVFSISGEDPEINKGGCIF